MHVSAVQILPYGLRVQTAPKFPTLASFQVFCNSLKSVVNNIKCKYFRQIQTIIMDSDNESYQSESEFYYHDKDFRCFRPFHKDFVENNKSVICQPSSIHIGKNCALGLKYGPPGPWHRFS